MSGRDAQKSSDAHNGGRTVAAEHAKVAEVAAPPPAPAPAACERGEGCRCLGADGIRKQGRHDDAAPLRTGEGERGREGRKGESGRGREKEKE